MVWPIIVESYLDEIGESMTGTTGEQQLESGEVQHRLPRRDEADGNVYQQCTVSRDAVISTAKWREVCSIDEKSQVHSQAHRPLGLIFNE